jgi:hypothetical protein
MELAALKVVWQLFGIPSGLACLAFPALFSSFAPSLPAYALLLSLFCAYVHVPFYAGYVEAVF